MGTTAFEQLNKKIKNRKENKPILFVEIILPEIWFKGALQKYLDQVFIKEPI